jgi:predicted nucleic acid-binding protein
MPDSRIFIDSNVLIYALGEDDSPDKKQKAVDLLCQKPVISTQVINECSNVLRRKFSRDYLEIQETLEFVLKISMLVEVNLSIIRQAWQIGGRYAYSYFDSLIIASALDAECEILYSEDMQHGQMIENQLKIVNPFQ